MLNFFGVDLESKYRHLCETPSDINDALPVLRQFASKVKHVTEFGIRTAVSTTALLAAQPDRLISYDVDLNRQFLDDLMRVKGRTNFTYHQGDTRLIDIEPTQLLFVDTQHTHRQMECELRRHSNKVSDYVIFHDTGISGYRFKDEGENDDPIKGIWPAIESWSIRDGFELCYELPERWGLSVFKRR